MSGDAKSVEFSQSNSLNLNVFVLLGFSNTKASFRKLENEAIVLYCLKNDTGQISAKLGSGNGSRPKWTPLTCVVDLDKGMDPGIFSDFLEHCVGDFRLMM